MNDIFKDYGSGLESPGFDAIEVSPNDSTDLATASRAIYIGTGGNIRLTMVSGQTVTLRNVGAGMLPLRVARIHNTGTTASDIVAVW